MCLILIFLYCIGLIGRFLSTHKYTIDYKFLVAKASVATLSWTSRIVFVTSQTALEDNGTFGAGNSWSTFEEPRWVKSYLSDVVLFYASQAVFLVVFWQMCGIVNKPTIEDYTQSEQDDSELKDDEEGDGSVAYWDQILL